MRERIGEHLDRAHLSGEAFLITRAGRGKAVLLGASQYLQLVERIEAMQAGKHAPPPERPKTSEKVVSTAELKALLK